MNLFNMMKTMIERSISRAEDLNHYYAKLDNYLRFGQLTQAQYDELKALLDAVLKPAALLIANLVVNDSNVVIKNLALADNEIVALNGEEAVVKESGANHVIEGLTHNTSYNLTVVRTVSGNKHSSDNLAIKTLTKPAAFKVADAAPTHNTIVLTGREMAANESVYINWKMYSHIENVDGVITVSNLTPETKYSVIVRRDEANGAYANSPAINVTTLAVPSEVK